MTDIFTTEIIQNALVAVGDEMFTAMVRTSMSPIVYEAKDFAVGATDARGNLLAQGNGLAAFLATLDGAVQSTIQRYSREGDIRPGDIFIANTPYEGGGTHLPDVSIILPVFDQEDLIAWTVNKAHWTEVGGATPGSVSTHAVEVYQEGLQFGFLKLYSEGRLNDAIVRIIRDNVRLPDSTIGDLEAGVAAARVGARRILELVARYGRTAVKTAMSELLDYGERMIRAELARLPHGVHCAEDIVEEDGLGNGPFAVKVKVTITPEKVIADFTGTSAQAKGPINCSYSGLVTAARCLFKAITNPTIPANGGTFRALQVICPPGTILSAESPAPVSVYYETQIAAMDVIWRAIASAMPRSLPAGHQRSVGATFITGTDPESGNLFVMGEPLVGGWGATADRDGDSGQFCCGNGETFNIPVELAEARFGLRVQQYAFHAEDGGHGQYRGGRGVVLDYEVLGEVASLTYAATRTVSRPWGLNGGGEGTHNYAEIIRTDGTRQRFSMCTLVPANRGDVIRLVTATGGGYGKPGDRSADAVAADVSDGYITAEQARQHYKQGVGSVVP
jgi:N-methylhydantoinase B